MVLMTELEKCFSDYFTFIFLFILNLNNNLLHQGNKIKDNFVLILFQQTQNTCFRN